MSKLKVVVVTVAMLAVLVVSAVPAMAMSPGGGYAALQPTCTFNHTEWQQIAPNEWNYYNVYLCKYSSGGSFTRTYGPYLFVNY